MAVDYSYGVAHKDSKRPGKPMRPTALSGKPETGRIVRILIGQGYGFIRMAKGREVYFHRGDLQEGTAFNDFKVGDVVKFELLEDAVSGARGLRVMRHKRAR